MMMQHTPAAGLHGAPDQQVESAESRRRGAQHIICAKCSDANILRVRSTGGYRAIINLQHSAPVMVSNAEHAQLGRRFAYAHLARQPPIEDVDLHFSPTISL